MNTIRSTGFEPVLAVGSLLSGLAAPWWITGGWAIDLAVGNVTRDHANVNVMSSNGTNTPCAGSPESTFSSSPTASRRFPGQQAVG